MKYDVFISYSRKDQVVVDEIRQLLDSNAITYWLDTEKVHMGSEFCTGCGTQNAESANLCSGCGRPL